VQRKAGCASRSLLAAAYDAEVLIHMGPGPPAPQQTIQTNVLFGRLHRIHTPSGGGRAAATKSQTQSTTSVLWATCVLS
jgi:hypothetical protein